MAQQLQQIIMDISGRLGLADNFHGDMDSITVRPNRIYKAKDGEMATGTFNPYIRDGYLFPATNNIFSLTAPTGANLCLNSVQFDDFNNKVFFADRGQYIYTLATLNSSSVTQNFGLGSGITIQDLEMYELAGTPRLYASYTSDKVTMLSEATSAADMVSIGLAVQPAASTQPIAVSTEQLKLTATVHNLSNVVPSGYSNMAALICFATRGSVTSVTFNGSAATQIGSVVSKYHLGELVNFYTYRAIGVTAGTRATVITTTTETLYSTVSVYANANQTTPFTNIVTNDVTGRQGVSLITSGSNYNYVQFLFATAGHIVYSSTPLSAFNQTAQTSTGVIISIENDGLNMYISGDATENTIYRYILGTPYDITTAVFSSSTAQTLQPDNTIRGIRFRNDGLRRYVLKSPNNLDITLYSIIPTAAWLTSNSSVSATLTLPATEYGNAWGFDITKDGKDIYIGCRVANEDTDGNRILHYELTTPWDLSTAIYRDMFRIVTGSFLEMHGMTLGPNDNSISYTILNNSGNSELYLFLFNPIAKRDVSKIKYVGEKKTIDDNTWITAVSLKGDRFYARNVTTTRCNQHVLGPTNVPGLSSYNDILEVEDYNKHNGLFVDSPEAPRLVDIAIVNSSLSTLLDLDWLSSKEVIPSAAKYNFMRKADNGFVYLFTQNRVSKIDGSSLGGDDGAISKNILLFPRKHHIVDAVDYRSKLFMAIHQHRMPSGNTVDMVPGSCGIYVWNRISTQLTKADYIDLPGVREIKKLYISPDQVLKMLVISENGLTEVREFGYNDSGGVVFRVKKRLGQGAYPEYPDGLTTMGDKVVWLASDGRVYFERDGVICIPLEINVSPTTAAGAINSITPGAIFYGSNASTADTGYRENRQALILNYYDDATVKMNRLYVFDLETKDGTTQVASTSDVFSPVKFLPVTSDLQSVRIYNYPTVGTATDAIAYVKIYFNQSSSVGMTKTITLKEASRGYVDLKVNKRYIHAVQIEIEWVPTEVLTENIYMPSLAVLTYDQTTTQSPDNE